MGKTTGSKTQERIEVDQVIDSESGARPNLDPEHLIGLIDKWRDRLGLGTEWSIGLKVIEDRKDGKKGFRDAFAYTEVDEAYFQADVTFHAWRFDGKDDAFVDLVACHEVLHVRLHKLEHLASRALEDEHLVTILTENVVEYISRALVRLQND